MDKELFKDNAHRAKDEFDELKESAHRTKRRSKGKYKESQEAQGRIIHTEVDNLGGYCNCNTTLCLLFPKRLSQSI